MSYLSRFWRQENTKELWRKQLLFTVEMRPVVVEGGQVQMLRHDVQLVLPQARQQVLGQNQGVDIGGMEIQARLGAALADEADVKLRVVGRQGPPVYKFQDPRR